MVFKIEMAVLLLLALTSSAKASPSINGPPTDDYDCVVTAIWFEARGEPELGQRWVFEVIRNRAALNYRGESTYCGVVYDRKQFSFANGNNSVRPSPRDKTEAQALSDLQLLVSEWMYLTPTLDVSCGATHYLRYDYVSRTKWARQAYQGNSDENLVPLARIGDHVFLGPKQSCKWR